MLVEAVRQVCHVLHLIDPDCCWGFEEVAPQAVVLGEEDPGLHKDERIEWTAVGSQIETMDHHETNRTRFVHGSYGGKGAGEGGSQVEQGRYVQSEVSDVSGRDFLMNESPTRSAKTWRKKPKDFWQAVQVSGVFRIKASPTRT